MRRFWQATAWCSGCLVASALLIMLLVNSLFVSLRAYAPSFAECFQQRSQPAVRAVVHAAPVVAVGRRLTDESRGCEGSVEYRVDQVLKGEVAPRQVLRVTGAGHTYPTGDDSFPRPYPVGEQSLLCLRPRPDGTYVAVDAEHGGVQHIDANHVDRVAGLVERLVDIQTTSPAAARDRAEVLWMLDALDDPFLGENTLQDLLASWHGFPGAELGRYWGTPGTDVRARMTDADLQRLVANLGDVRSPYWMRWSVALLLVDFGDPAIDTMLGQQLCHVLDLAQRDSDFPGNDELFQAVGSPTPRSLVEVGDTDDLVWVLSFRAARPEVKAAARDYLELELWDPDRLTRLGEFLAALEQ